MARRTYTETVDDVAGNAYWYAHVRRYMLWIFTCTQTLYIIELSLYLLFQVRIYVPLNHIWLALFICHGHINNNNKYIRT